MTCGTGIHLVLSDDVCYHLYHNTYYCNNIQLDFMLTECSSQVNKKLDLSVDMIQYESELLNFTLKSLCQNDIPKNKVITPAQLSSTSPFYCCASHLLLLLQLQFHTSNTAVLHIDIQLQFCILSPQSLDCASLIHLYSNMTMCARKHNLPLIAYGTHTLQQIYLTPSDRFYVVLWTSDLCGYKD